MEGAVVLKGAVPTRGEDQFDRLLAAADRTGLRPLPEQAAIISWEEMEGRIARRKKNDECPPANVQELRWQIARLRQELEHCKQQLQPKPITAVHTDTPGTARPGFWRMTQSEFEAREQLRARERELPELIRSLEKELEKASWVPKAQLHLRGFIHRPGKDYAQFNREPEKFDLILQGLLPQLKDDELFVVLAEVAVDGAAALELYGSRKRRVDFRPFMVHRPAEFETVLQRAAKKKVLFCGYKPQPLI